MGWTVQIYELRRHVQDSFWNLVHRRGGRIYRREADKSQHGHSESDWPSDFRHSTRTFTCPSRELRLTVEEVQMRPRNSRQMQVKSSFGQSEAII
ncbi:hypothetical protein ACLOJK_000467 [Asimina triloba]